MKYTIAILTGAAFAAAQSSSAATGLAAIPSCGQMCINNMVQIANTQFGCSNGNVTCYCSDPRFGYGLNDCSLQACGAAVQSQVLSFGLAYCSSAGVAANTGAPSVVSSASASAAGSGAGAVPITTSAILTTVSASNTLYTSTVGSTTIYSTPASGSGSSHASGATGAAGNATSGAGGAISSGVSGASSAGSAGASKASSAGSAGASGASSAAGGASSSSSSGMGAIVTVAPMVGVGAIAALFML